MSRHVCFLLGILLAGCTSDSPTQQSDSALKEYIQTPKERAGAVSDDADARNAELEEAAQALDDE